MFVVDPAVQRIRAGRDQIVTLVESINRPHVAVPGKQAQNAQAFVVGIRRPTGDFNLYVYLWLVQTEEAVVYAPDGGTVPLESYREVELEALQFCESMGFMTEPVGFRNLAPEAQDELLSRLPPFRAHVHGSAAPAAVAPEPTVDDEPFPPSPPPAAAVSPERRERLVRLLGSF